VPQTSLIGSSWQGSLRDLALVLNQIKRARAFGRLSLRNSERLSIAHLYFRAGKLVHGVGNRGDFRAVLHELQAWTRGVVRFERGVTTVDVTLNEEHERMLVDTLMFLQSRGVVMVPPTVPRVIESNVIVSPEAKQLIAPGEWRVLVEATRRVSLAVAHLVGPQEALKVLQDILDDCSSAFPAFTCLKIAPSGYLQVTDRTQLDLMSREEVFEGFTALIATCQYFCSPIIGDQDAHRLIIQALQDICPALVNMGVFHIDTQLLSSSRSI
jgi:hypothetical protein